MMQLFLVVSSPLSVVVQDLNHFQNHDLVLPLRPQPVGFHTDWWEGNGALFNKGCVELSLTWGSATASPQVFLCKGGKPAGSEML